MPEQRRLDRVLEAAYLAGLADRPVDEVSAMKAECTDLETEVSLDAERKRRDSGGSLEDLIGSLSKILADDGPRPSPAQAHLPQRMAPSPDIEWTRGLEPLVGDSTLARLPDLTDAELADVREQLSALEREVSAKRKALHDVLHVLEQELAQRIQAARS
jgi:hypothetical protein